MSYSWEITADAVQDLYEIRRYVISYAGTQRAEALLDEFESAFAELCEHPLFHAVYQFPEDYEPEHDYRSMTLYRYKIFYRVDEKLEKVLIYRIRHVASDFTRTGL